MPERRDVALLLQFEAHAIDAAGGIDGEHEREVDGLGRLRGDGESEGNGEYNEAASEAPHAPTCHSGTARRAGPGIHNHE